MKANRSNTKIIIYKNVLQEDCEKFNDVEAFVKERIEEPCNEKEAVEEVTYLFMNDYNNF